MHADPHPVAICFNLLWVAALISYALHEALYSSFSLKYLAHWNWLLQCIFGGLMLIASVSAAMERLVILSGLFLVNGVVWVNAIAITVAMAVNPHMLWAAADFEAQFVGLVVVRIVVTSYVPVLCTIILAISRRKMIRATLKLATESTRPFVFTLFYLAQAVVGPLGWILLHTAVFGSVHYYGLEGSYAVWILCVIAIAAVFNTCLWFGFMLRLTPPAIPVYAVAQPMVLVDPESSAVTTAAAAAAAAVVASEAPVVRAQNQSAPTESTPLLLV